MPNARRPGTKLAGAYIEQEKDAALTRLAVERGFADKASFIRALFDDALNASPEPTESPKPKRGAKGKASA